jgi:cobaltochelatase CobT
MDFEAVVERLGYRVYTTEFDEVCDVRERFHDDELRRFRADAEEYRLYGADRPSRFNDSTDAADLEAAVEELRSGLERAVAELGIDAGRSLIGFLVDTSGSVRNLKSVYARAMHRVCETLDGIGFQTTVVGHTTAGWKGGESRKKWLDEGRVTSPGRLNDLLVTVYKEPHEPMVADDLRLYGLNMPSEHYKENIDGEALAWMAQAMSETDADDRSIVFLGDGDFPCDDSTIWANGADFLLDHRSAVIDEIMTSSDMSLVHVVATERENPEILVEPRCDIPRFGKEEPKSSDLVSLLAQAVDRSLRMQAEKVVKPDPKKGMSPN